MNIRIFALILSFAMIGALPVFAQQENLENYTYQEVEEEKGTVVNSQDLPIVKFLQNTYSIEDITDVSTVWDNCSDKNDVFVTLYLSKVSGTSPIEINMLRRKGAHWGDIIGRLNVTPSSVLPQFANCPVSDLQRGYVTQIITLQNWLKNENKNLLYDKTLRHLCIAQLLVDLKNFTPIKAAQLVQMQGEPIDVIYKLFVKED